jgi:cell division protein FtsI (penicillin-binding protein 3)
VASFIALLLFTIIFRLVNIQYVQGEKYKKLATELTVKEFKIKANKGNVYAADGNLLATSMSKYTIRMDVMAAVKNKIFEKNIAALSKELSKMLGKSVSYYQNKLRTAKRRKNRYLLVARNIGYNDYF